MLETIKGCLSDISQPERNAMLFSFNLNKVRTYLVRNRGWKLEGFPTDYELEIAMYIAAAETPTFKYRKWRREAQLWIIQHLHVNDDKVPNVRSYKVLRGLNRDRMVDIILDNADKCKSCYYYELENTCIDKACNEGIRKRINLKDGGNA